MLKDYEVEYLSVKEYLSEEEEAEFCFDHLIIKGELVVLVCEKEQNFKIFSGAELNLVTNLYLSDLSDRYPTYKEKNVKFHDITVIQHDPAVYQIYVKIEVGSDGSDKLYQMMLLEVYTTIEPTVFMQFFNFIPASDVFQLP